jgi:addiction module HigA family antidote
MRPIHPGEILRDELAELGLSAHAFARALNIPINRVTQILREQRGVSADTALRLGRYFRHLGRVLDGPAERLRAAPRSSGGRPRDRAGGVSGRHSRPATQPTARWKSPRERQVIVARTIRRT